MAGPLSAVLPRPTLPAAADGVGVAVATGALDEGLGWTTMAEETACGEDEAICCTAGAGVVLPSSL